MNSNIKLVKAFRIYTNDKQPARYFISNTTQMIVGASCFPRSAAFICQNLKNKIISKEYILKIKHLTK